MTADVMRAQRAVLAAVRAGRMCRASSCEACGRLRAPDDGPKAFVHHHWSYAPEHATATIQLCASCHCLVHLGSVPEPRTGRIYRRRGLTDARALSILANHDGPFRIGELRALGGTRVRAAVRIGRDRGWLRREGACKGSVWWPTPALVAALNQPVDGGA